MKSYWFRLLLKLVLLLLVVVGAVYLVESCYPGMIEWKKVFNITSDLIRVWGNIIVIVLFVVYMGYTREKLTRSLGPHLLDLKKQAIEAKDSLVVSVNKINQILESLDSAIQTSKNFMESEGWKEKMDEGMQHLQKRFQEIVQEMELKGHASELKDSMMEFMREARNMMDTLNATNKDIQKFLQSEEWKNVIKETFSGMQKKINQLTQEIDTIRLQMDKERNPLLTSQDRKMLPKADADNVPEEYDDQK
ncbi:MAG: hypothetical protein HUU50_05485 [Candidatus Brocadiae bacterium]|nr:hypothetical protein [Candidatus Brocadiia bacterium]